MIFGHFFTIKLKPCDSGNTPTYTIKGRLAGTWKRSSILADAKLF